MPIYLVKVRGGVSNLPADPMEDGDFDIDLNGTVAVEAANEGAAREKALDVLMGDGAEAEPVLDICGGDPVEFEVESVSLAPSEASS